MLDALGASSDSPERTGQVHSVASGENLTVIARKYGVSVKDIVGFNGIRDRNALRIGQQIRIPPSRMAVADEAPGEDVHFVRRGETLARIARRYGVEMKELAELNGITDVNFVHVGQPLKIPGLAPGAAPQDYEAPASVGHQTYIVKSGDALARIAKKFRVSLKDLQRLNGIANANKIKVNQKLMIPGTVSSGGGESSGPVRSEETSVSQEVAEVTEISQGQVDTSQIQNTSAMQTVIGNVLRVAPRHDYAKGAIPGILRQCAASGVRNASQVAYILATADHETDFGKPTFGWSESLVEDSNSFRKGRNGWSAQNHVSGGRSTGSTKGELERRYWDDAYGGKLGNKRGTSDASNYRGRGYVQLTGKSNYKKMTKDLNAEGFVYELDGVKWGKDKPIDLVANPTHVNRNKELAARCLVEGMTDGLFTGAKLGSHVNDRKTDYYNARSVVNGDKRTNGRSIERTARRYAGALSRWSSVFRGQS